MYMRVNKVIHTAELIPQLAGCDLLALLGQEMPAAISLQARRVFKKGWFREADPHLHLFVWPHQATD